MGNAGHDVNRDQVVRLMGIVGIEGVRRGKDRTRTTWRDDKAARHPDLINRAWSTPTRPDQWWVADFTYVWTLVGFVYVSFVTVVLSRRILGGGSRHPRRHPWSWLSSTRPCSPWDSSDSETPGGSVASAATSTPPDIVRRLERFSKGQRVRLGGRRRRDKRMMVLMEVEQRSPIRFARVDGAAIAYQMFGNGPTTVVTVPPMAQNIELLWERREFRSLFGRFATFARVLHFDKRGTGASDRAARMPTIDQRVEDLVAVMDAAGVGRAHLLGLSEGGPVAIALAATYPERVETLTLFGSGARMVGDLTDEERETRHGRLRYFRDRWGTDESITLDLFAPSVAGDAGYREWEPRYERQSATPAALEEMLEMLEAIDVRPLLGSVTAPTLILHRRDDAVMPVAFARETAALLPSAHLVELDGSDHMAHVGDVDGWVDHYERFVAGTVSPRPAPRARHDVRITTMGGFRVSVGDEQVSSNAWGSRQARLVCKRLAVAVDRPVPRDELADLLWPDELDPVKRSARLSVVLSNIRRVLGGGLIADRDAVRLDLDMVDLDLAALHRAVTAGDDAAVAAAYAGPILPEDAYEDWASAARDRAASAAVSARRRLAGAAAEDEHWDDVVDHARAALDLDGFDERTHEMLVRALVSAGRRGEAQVAAERYRQRMTEIGVQPHDLLAPHRC